MTAYLFTLHAYRSWNADDPRGYVQKGRGVLMPDIAQARIYDSLAKQAPVLFMPVHQQILLGIVWDACRRRNWRLHFVACEPSHIHLLVSWHEFDPWQRVRGKLKNLMARELGRQLALPGYRWFSDEGSRKRVRDRRHFDHLMRQYLPRHRGLVWREGDALPELPSAPADG